MTLPYIDDKSLISSLSHNYCYQFICQGDPVWPENNLVNDEVKAVVESICVPLRQMLNRKVTLRELARSPSTFVKFLLHINTQIEREIKLHNAYDVRRPPLPKLLNVLSSPTTHWRFITISMNALSSFARKPLTQGYQNQLQLFYEVFNFKKLRYNKYV